MSDWKGINICPEIDSCLFGKRFMSVSESVHVCLKNG